MLPDGFRIPVLVLLRNEIAALEDENTPRAVGKRVSHRPTAGAAADNDDVVAFGPHQAVRRSLEYTQSISS
jgi:hypothetical protein